MTPIVIHEVGPRDGLQMEQQVVPIDTKEDWIRRAMESGVDIVQVGSFVHPVKVPQMADTDELIRRLVADKDSRIGTVTEVMDQVKLAGVQGIAISADNPSGNQNE